MPAADATRATAMRDSFKWDFARGLSFFSLSWYYFLIFKFARDPSFFLLSLYFFVFFARGLSFFSLSALCLGRGGHVVCSSVDPCFSTSGPSSVPPFHFFLIFVKTSVSFSFSLLLSLCSVFHPGDKLCLFVHLVSNPLIRWNLSDRPFVSMISSNNRRFGEFSSVQCSCFQHQIQRLLNPFWSHSTCFR